MDPTHVHLWFHYTDPTSPDQTCPRLQPVSDKVWSVSNSTTRTQGVVCDPTGPDSRTKCVHVETERTSLRPDKVCGLVGDPSGPWVWSGRVRVVEFSYISAACGPLLHLPHVAWSVCDTLRSFATLGVSLEEESVWTVKMCKKWVLRAQGLQIAVAEWLARLTAV